MAVSKKMQARLSRLDGKACDSKEVGGQCTYASRTVVFGAAPELIASLDRLALQRSVSRSELIRGILLDYLSSDG